MVALLDLAPASFRGAGFLVPRDHVEEGRNTIDFKYPGTNYRYAADNGGTPPEFHLTCYLHGAKLSADWQRLRSALNRPGPGTLRHPWYGSHVCAVKGPFKVARTDQDSGVLEITVVFLVTGAAIYPSALTGIAASISSLAAKAVTTAFGAFVGNVATPDSPFSREYLQTMLAGVAEVAAEEFPSTAEVVKAADAVESELP